MQQSNLNQTTRIMVATAKYLDDLELCRIMQRGQTCIQQSEDGSDPPPASVKVVFTLLRINHVHFLTTITVFDTEPDLHINSYHGGQQSFANRLDR